MFDRLKQRNCVAVINCAIHVVGASIQRDRHDSGRTAIDRADELAANQLEINHFTVRSKLAVQAVRIDEFNRCIDIGRCVIAVIYSEINRICRAFCRVCFVRPSLQRVGVNICAQQTVFIDSGIASVKVRL